MFEFNTSHRFYQRSGLFLLLAQFSLFLCGLPLFQAGIWHQGEPILDAIFIFAVLDSIWLVTGFFMGWLKCTFPRPLLLCLLLWVGWQLLATAFATSYWRSWFGPVETGEGTGRSIALLLLTIAACPLWQVESYRRIILRCAAVNIILQIVLRWLYPSGDESAYLAFMAGNLWIAAASSGMMCLPSAARAGKKWRTLAIVACFLPMGWIAYSFAYGGSASNDRDEGIGLRMTLNQVAVSTMQHEPNRWQAGGGWGRFSDDLFKYALVDGVYVYHDGVEEPNWSLLEGGTFHSHNQPLEVLLSLGLPGLLLWFAFPVIALITLPRHLFWTCAPTLVALVTAYYFWFEMPQCLAYDALLLAALSSACHFTPRPALTGKPFASFIAACGVAMLWSICQQTGAMAYSHNLAHATQAKSYKDYTLDWLASDLKRGGDRLRAASIAYGKLLGNKKVIDDNDIGWYALFIESTHIAALSPLTGAYVTSAELWMQYKLLLDFGESGALADLGGHALSLLPGAALQLCRKAPLRDDYATMFLLNLPYITHHDKLQQYGILINILTIAPGHRPALLLIGKLLASQNGRETQGKELVRYAASLGVEKVYPLTDIQLEALSSMH